MTPGLTSNLSVFAKKAASLDPSITMMVEAMLGF
jgi:hypothetical protein